MPHRTTLHRPSTPTKTHRHHPAYAPRPVPSGVHSSDLGAQLIIAALSFAVIIGAAFHAFGTTLAN